MTKYFAKLGLNSKVETVRLIHDNVAPTEQVGIEHLNKTHSYPFWRQTYKDRSKRKNFAAKGMIYDEKRDAFIHPQPYPSWTLNEDTCQWEAPVPRPDRSTGCPYNWDETTGAWIKHE